MDEDRPSRSREIPVLPDPIARARHRNERQIAIMVIAVTAAAGLAAATRLASHKGGLELLIFAAFVASYYALILRRLRSGKPEQMWRLWVRASFEVSTAMAGMLINLHTVDPVFALTSGTGYIFGFAVALSSLRLHPLLPIYVASLGVVEEIAVYLLAHGWQTGLLSLAGPVFAFRLVVLFMMGLLGSILARTLRSETAKAAEEVRVRTAFGSYVDRRVVERVLRGDLQLAPERRRVTVLFIDIRDFTSLSEKSDPAQVFRMLDEALDTFAGDVQKQGGIVNKFLGDGLMALFGAPEEQEDHPRRAVRAALRIAESARRMANDGRFPSLRIGIGIHTGEVVAGDIGTQRREYTAIGDVVNVASRVEAANKELGTTILITREVKDALGGGAQLRPQPALQLRGRTAPTEVFEVLDLEGTVEKKLEIPLGSVS